jgi:hypothetical protein
MINIHQSISYRRRYVSVETVRYMYPLSEVLITYRADGYRGYY